MSLRDEEVIPGAGHPSPSPCESRASLLDLIVRIDEYREELLACLGMLQELDMALVQFQKDHYFC